MFYIEVRVGDTPASSDPTANALCSSNTIYSTNFEERTVVSLACTPPLTGRYLVVRMPPEWATLREQAAELAALSLCEVRAFGAMVSSPPSPPR